MEPTGLLPIHHSFYCYINPSLSSLLPSNSVKCLRLHCCIWSLINTPVQEAGGTTRGKVEALRGCFFWQKQAWHLLCILSGQVRQQAHWEKRCSSPHIHLLPRWHCRKGWGFSTEWIFKRCCYQSSQQHSHLLDFALVKLQPRLILIPRGSSWASHRRSVPLIICKMVPSGTAYCCYYF